MTTMYRHGDVLLIKTSHTLSDHAKARPRENGRVILAHGEASGHAHAIDSPLAELFDEVDGTLYLKVTPGEPTALRHEEHAPITIDPGVYRVVRQREYVSREDDWRTVED